MKLLYMVSKWPPIGGGAATGAYNLATALSRRNEVHVLTEAVNGLPRLEMHGNLTVERTEAPLKAGFAVRFSSLALRMGLRAAALLHEGRFDLMHVHDVAVGPAGLIAKRLAKTPTVFKWGGHLTYEYVCLRGPEGWNPAAGELAAWRQKGMDMELVRGVEKDFFRTFERSYLLGEYQKGLLGEMGIDGNFPVIPNGIDAKGFRHRKTSNRPVIFTGLRHVPWKGLDTLIRACNGQLDRWNAKLVIAGDGPDTRRLQQLAGEDRNISFIGNIPYPEMKKRLSESAVYVFPSLVDRCPHALLEAMASRLPVVASDVMGIRELVPDRCGLLFRPGDHLEMREKIGSLLDSSKMSRRMGAAARRNVITNYSFERTRRGVVSLYSDLLG
ncbi:MAG: glycosyltransferase family 4 protein [Candidatus Aenigmatarchaeota archaeon]